MLSNSPNVTVPPNGSGLDDVGDRPFHLSLLHERLWGRDDFLYLAFLPRELSFEHDPLFAPLAADFDMLPIQEDEFGRWKLKTEVAETWLKLEWHVVATYNVLKDLFGGLVPLRTKLPPCPRSTAFWAPHAREDEARRAAHRARRYFHPWLCLLAMFISNSRCMAGPGPSEWFKALVNFRPRFEPFWLDNIELSPILTCFDSTMPRRGLVVNMVHNWSFLDGYPFRDGTCMPIWLCFPHGATWIDGLGKSLRPSSEAVELAKLQKGKIPIDRVRYPPPARNSVEYCDDHFDPFDAMATIADCEPSGSELLDLVDGPETLADGVESVMDASASPITLAPPMVAEVDRLVFSSCCMDRFEDVLRFRYGIAIPPVLSTTSITSPPSTRSPSLLKCVRGMVQEKALDDPDWQRPEMVTLLERFADLLFAGKGVAPDISDCHAAEDSFLTRHDIWKMRPFRVCTEGSFAYGFRVHDASLLGRLLTVKDIVSVREVLRRRWGPNLVDVARPLLDRGVTFRIGYASPPPTMSCPVTYVPRIFRPDNYSFTYRDYFSYVRRRLALFKDLGVAEPAVREGGILWRLALESQVDLDKCLMMTEDCPAYELDTLQLHAVQWSVRVLPDAIVTNETLSRSNWEKEKEENSRNADLMIFFPYEEVDRAIDNLVKSGKLWNAPRRDSMPMMMGRPYPEYGMWQLDPIRRGVRPSDSKFRDRPSHGRPPAPPFRQRV